MVDTVSHSALRTLVGTQTALAHNGLSALKNNAPAQKAVLESFAPSEKTGLRANLVSGGGMSNVPRGSLVDFLV